jgi:hypothetical protein
MRLRDAVSYERGVSRDWTITYEKFVGKSDLFHGMGRVDDYFSAV